MGMPPLRQDRKVHAGRIDERKPEQEEQNKERKKMTVCKRCGLPVYKEKDWSLRKTYPYYCPQCDENMFKFEVIEGEPQQDYYL